MLTLNFTGKESKSKNEAQSNNTFQMVFKSLRDINDAIFENVLLSVNEEFHFKEKSEDILSGSLILGNIVKIECKGKVDCGITDFKFSVEWQDEILNRGIDLSCTGGIFTIDEMMSDVIKSICEVLKKAGYISVGD